MGKKTFCGRPPFLFFFENRFFLIVPDCPSWLEYFSKFLNFFVHILGEKCEKQAPHRPLFF